MPQLSLMTPVGDLTLFEDGGAIVAVEWGRVPNPASTALLEEARDQLQAYFNGTFKAFSLRLDPHGTAFHKRVWKALCAIPYGQTRSYGELAADLQSSARAVGTGYGRNPLPIVIPCHRVLGAGGRLGGFSGGAGPETKRALLTLEGALLTLEGALLT